MSEKSNHAKTPAKQHNNQPPQNSKMINKLLIIQWCFVFETKHHWMIKSLSWYVLCRCVVDCCVISFLTFATLQEENETKLKIELCLCIKGEFRFFYAISVETIQLTIILMVLHSLFAFVVDCCITSFLTHCIHRAKGKKGQHDKQGRNKQRRRRWV